MDFHCRTHGKLLLTGEYAVLDGATALALPSKFGQTLEVTSIPGSHLEWRSLDQEGKIWMQNRYEREELLNQEWDRWEDAEGMVGWLLQDLLRGNPNIWPEDNGISVKTQLEFPANWGLGSSSTLVAALAQWAGVNAFELNRRSFGGSGYDIACALAKGPILYSLAGENQRYIDTVEYSPAYSDSIFFIHLNQKQDSREGIETYRGKEGNKQILAAEISELTNRVLKADSLDKFMALMEEHENLISRAIGLPTVKQKLFADYPGTVKSLGAWGGDFILVTAAKDELSYFRERGYSTILSYKEMLL